MSHPSADTTPPRRHVRQTVRRHEAHAEPGRPVLRAVLTGVIVVLLVPAVLALIEPLLADVPTGFHLHRLAFVAGVFLGAVAVQAVRGRRFALSSQAAAWAGLGAAAVPVALGIALSEILRPAGRFVAVPTALPWAAAVGALLLQLVLSRLQRRPGRPRSG